MTSLFGLGLHSFVPPCTLAIKTLNPPLAEYVFGEAKRRAMLESGCTRTRVLSHSAVSPTERAGSSQRLDDEDCIGGPVRFSIQ